MLLDLGVLPVALREAAQSGSLWMAWIYLPGFRGLFNPANPIWMLVGTRLQLLPRLTDNNLSGLTWHIRGITALAIGFVVVGALIRLDGLG